jgi:hypothetical protein
MIHGPGGVACRPRTVAREVYAAIADCPELQDYRARDGQDTEIREALDRIDLEIRRINLDIEIAKGDRSLRGEDLAKRLAQLTRDRQAAEARIPDLCEGLKAFKDDVERSREAAKAALVKLARQVGTEVYQAARLELAAATDNLLAAMDPHLDDFVPLTEAGKPPMMVESLYAEALQQALDGELPENPETDAGPLESDPAAPAPESRGDPEAEPSAPATPAPTPPPADENAVPTGARAPRYQGG